MGLGLVSASCKRSAALSFVLNEFEIVNLSFLRHVTRMQLAELNFPGYRFQLVNSVSRSGSTIKRKSTSKH